MVSFSFICKSCGKFAEYHNFEELKRCNLKLKDKKGNLDAYF